MGIGTRIRQLRKQTGLTQPELAEKIGVHETTIRRWEQERDKGPDIKTVNILAEVLKTTPEYLLMDTPGDPAPKVPGQTKDLIYEWEGHRLALPNTPETREMFERIVMQTMHNPAMI